MTSKTLSAAEQLLRAIFNDPNGVHKPNCSCGCKMILDKPIYFNDKPFYFKHLPFANDRR